MVLNESKISVVRTDGGNHSVDVRGSNSFVGKRNGLVVEQNTTCSNEVHESPNAFHCAKVSTTTGTRFIVEHEIKQ